MSRPAVAAVPGVQRPLIAIVGRPNVGKSSLFNRLIGRRRALVRDVPGVTRDRLYGQLEFERWRATVVDTGGFDPSSQEPLVEGVRRHVLIAVDEADLVLLVVDAPRGPDGAGRGDRRDPAPLRPARRARRQQGRHCGPGVGAGRPLSLGLRRSAGSLRRARTGCGRDAGAAPGARRPEPHPSARRQARPWPSPSSADPTSASRRSSMRSWEPSAFSSTPSPAPPATPSTRSSPTAAAPTC